MNFFLAELETYFFALTGVYVVTQVWNLFEKKYSQKQVFVQSLCFAAFWLVLDPIFAYLYSQ